MHCKNTSQVIVFYYLVSYESMALNEEVFFCYLVFLFLTFLFISFPLNWSFISLHYISKLPNNPLRRVFKRVAYWFCEPISVAVLGLMHQPTKTHQSNSVCVDHLYYSANIFNQINKWVAFESIPFMLFNSLNLIRPKPILLSSTKRTWTWLLVRVLLTLLTFKISWRF